MITNCPVCGKGFDILWPHLWRYKRGNSYLCSWKCLRLTDKTSERKKAEEVYKKPEKRVRMKPDDMETALNLFRSGDSSLDQFLKDHGITHVAKWKANAKARHPEQVSEVKVDGPVPSEMPENCVKGPVSVDEFYKMVHESQFRCIATTMEYKTTGISTPIGDWQYIKKAGYLDWTMLTGETVSMRLEEWKELMELFPEVLKVLEVKL